MQGSNKDDGSRHGGLWTEAEHALFLEGVERYGWGQWKCVSDNLIPHRTRVQVATHAHKFLARVKRLEAKRRPPSSGPLPISPNFPPLVSMAAVPQFPFVPAYLPPTQPPMMFVSPTTVPAFVPVMYPNQGPQFFQPAMPSPAPYNFLAPSVPLMMSAPGSPSSPLVFVDPHSPPLSSSSSSLPPTPPLVPAAATAPLMKPVNRAVVEEITRNFSLVREYEASLVAKKRLRAEMTLAAGSTTKAKGDCPTESQPPAKMPRTCEDLPSPLASLDFLHNESFDEFFDSILVQDFPQIAKAD